MMKSIRRILVITVITWAGLLANLPAYAGPYTDDLSKCIIESTTANDRIEFVKWMFSAMSRHPAVKSMSSISEQQISEANEKVAELFMKLMTETCKDKAQKAVKYEGQIAIQTGFQILGQVAAQELFSDPDVAALMSGLDKYIDNEKLNSALGLE